MESFSLLDFTGLQAIRPHVTPKYSCMSLENRYDRWVMERDGNNKTNGKTYDEYKEALMNTTNNWFTSEKGIYYYYHYFMTSVPKPESVATTRCIFVSSCHIRPS